MDRFDTPATPAPIPIPPVIARWMSPWGNAEFVRMVREHGHGEYEIDSLGISSISAACSDALYDSYNVQDIQDTITRVAISVAEAHLDKIELMRDWNEQRKGLKMPPLALPVEREIERSRGMAGNPFNPSATEEACNGYECDGCDWPECPECATCGDSYDDDAYESYEDDM